MWYYSLIDVHTIKFFFLLMYDCHHVKLISTLDSEINQQVQFSNSTLAVVSPQYVGTWMDDYRSSLAAWWCSSMSLYLHGPIIKLTMTVVSWQQRQHIVIIILYELLMILSSIITCPLKWVTIILIICIKRLVADLFVLLWAICQQYTSLVHVIVQNALKRWHVTFHNILDLPETLIC